MKRGQVAPKRKVQLKAQKQPVKAEQPKQASAEDDDFEDMVLEDVPVDDMAEGGDAGEPFSESAAAMATAAASAKKKAKRKKVYSHTAVVPMCSSFLPSSVELHCYGYESKGGRSSLWKWPRIMASTSARYPDAAIYGTMALE